MSLAAAEAKADMDQKTARKYRCLGKMPHEIRVDQFCCLGEVFFIRFILDREGRGEVCDLLRANPQTSPYD